MPVAQSALAAGAAFDNKLSEICIDSQSVYRGHFLDAYRDRVSLPDGSESVREYVKHPGAVMVVPLLDVGLTPSRQAFISNETLLVLERQFRYPLHRVMIEFPAGKLDAGEAPFRCAQRELWEETGYTATLWARAGVLHPVIAYSNEFIELWFAAGLSAHPRRLDSGEFLDVWTQPVREFMVDCQQGQVTDAKTLVAALWLQNLISGAWALDWHEVPPVLAPEPQGFSSVWPPVPA